MLTSLENKFRKSVPVSEFLNTPSIEGLASILKREENFPAPAFVTLRNGGSKPPFFLIHNHAGSILEYHALSSHFKNDQPIYALPAFYPNEAEINDVRIEVLAANYLKELKSAQSEGPYYLGGYCLGGLIAFEIAQQLKSQGDRVAFLAMIQTTARGYPVYLAGTTFFHRGFYKISKRIDIERTNLQALSVKGKQFYLLERIRRTRDIIQSRIEMLFASLISTDHSWNKKHSFVYKLFVITRAYNRAFEKYVPKAYWGDVVILPAAKQPKGIHSDSTLGWSKIIQGNIEVYEVPGHQQTMLKRHNLETLATRLKECLRKRQREEGTIF